MNSELPLSEKYDPQLAKQFNLGSDARIAGQPRPTPNQFTLFSDYASFVRGYDHVHKYWGIDSKRAVKPLCRVKYGNSGSNGSGVPAHLLPHR